MNNLFKHIKRVLIFSTIMLIFSLSFIGSISQTSIPFFDKYKSHAVVGVDDVVIWTVILSYLSACGCTLAFSAGSDTGSASGVLSTSLKAFCDDYNLDYDTFCNGFYNKTTITDSGGFLLASDLVSSLNTYVDWFKDFYLTDIDESAGFDVSMYDNLSTVQLGDYNASLMLSSPSTMCSEYSSNWNYGIMPTSCGVVLSSSSFPMIIHNNGWTLSITSDSSFFYFTATNGSVSNSFEKYRINYKNGVAESLIFCPLTYSNGVTYVSCGVTNSYNGNILVSTNSGNSFDFFSSVFPILSSDISTSSVNAVGSGVVTTPDERILDYQQGQDVIVQPADGSGQSISNDDVLSYATSNDFVATFEGADSNVVPDTGSISTDGSISGDGSGSGIFGDIGNWILDIPILGSILEAIIHGFDSILAFLQALFNGLTGSMFSVFESIVSILSAIYDLISAGTISSLLTQLITLITTGIQNLIDSISDLFNDLTDFFRPSLDFAQNFFMSGVKDKFPFSIPFDLISMFTFLNAEPECPVFNIPVHIPVFDIDYTFNLNFDDFSSLASILRNIEFIAFAVLLALMTRSVIRG